MDSKPIDPEDLQRQIAELQAKLAASQQASVGGSGAAAQGGSDALGAGAVKLDDNSGTIVTGTLIVNNYYHSSETTLSKEEIARQVAGYLRRLQARTGSIVLRGIERTGGAQVVVLPLETAYVPLRARPMPRMGETTDGVHVQRKLSSGGRYNIDDKHIDEPQTDIALNEVISLANHLVIIGGPGCGKTTVLLHMAWALASSLLSGQPDPAHSRLGMTMAPHKLPLPIFVPLASFARYRRHVRAGSAAREKTLAHFISHHLVSKEADFDLPGDFFMQLLQHGQDVILLLDGLDEVANEDERAEVRESVENLISGREAMRVLVTCRTVAYRSGRTALGADFREIDVQPLDAQQHIAPMVAQAYACIFPNDGAQRAERIDDLLSGIWHLEEERRARLGNAAEALVSSPLMVRLLLIVHFNNRALPDERADLFDKAINALLQVDYGHDESDIRELSKDWTLYRDMAQHLAFHMHGQGLDQGREIDEAALKRALREEVEFRPHIDAFLGHARQRGSVLEERGGTYRFIHLAFQEFLVARYLREVTGGESRDAVVAVLQHRLDDPWWREPILLLAGYWRTKAPKPARALLSALMGTGEAPDACFSAAELAGTAALEWRESGEAIRADCAHRIVTLLNNADALAQSRPIIRARAGDVLARLGDQRFDPQRFHLPADDLLGFVRVPANRQFRIGTRKTDAKRVAEIIGSDVPDAEISDALTPTAEFYIARYLVTVAQFRTFVDAARFKLGASGSLRDPDNRPARFVNWHEAMAYCEWLNAVVATSPLVQGNRIALMVQSGAWRVALPSEQEWERAARGALSGRVYPWGDEPDPNRANCAEAAIYATTAVGCFEANNSGLYDMIGNVWEWTRSRYTTSPYRAQDGRENDSPTYNDLVVVRGGSWNDPRDRTRCALRNVRLPILRDANLGFRVILRASPVP